MNSKPQYHGWSGVLHKVLEFVSTPWKAVWIVFVGVLIAVGFLIWEERAFLREYISKREQPTLLRSDAELVSAIDDIFAATESTSVDAIAIWSVNVGNNRMEARSGQRRDGSNWEKRPAIAPWIHPTINTDMLTKILHGQVACNDPKVWAPPGTGTGGLIAQFLVSDNMAWTCYIPEPPSTVEPPIGIVVLAWREKPDDTRERSAVAAVLSLTAKIVQGGRFLRMH